MALNSSGFTLTDDADLSRAGILNSSADRGKAACENVRHKDRANRIHNEVGRKVRKTIHELGGTMPENLHVAESIKKVESREKKRLKV